MMGKGKPLNCILIGVCVVCAIYGFYQPSRSFTLDDILKGPLAQDNKQLVQLIKDHYIHNPAPSDAEYNFKSVVSADSWQLDGQFNQAKNISGLLQNMKNGFFIECGAANGETFSNSLLFEMKHQWRGLLIEANPYSFSELKTKNRKAYSLNACLSPGPYPQQIQFEALENNLLSGLKVDGKSVADKWRKAEDKEIKDSITTQCFPFYSILLAVGNPTVHYFSLDVEGVELDILRSIPWDKVDIKVLTIEYTHIDWRAVQRLLWENGYTLRYAVGEDMVFVKNSFVI